MTKLSDEAKLKIIEKALNRNGETLKSIAQRHNIGLSTLNKWIRKHKNNGTIDNQKGNVSTSMISMADRLDHLIASASMNEEELGAYCREHGLYSFQLTEWKEAFMTPNKVEKKSSEKAQIKSLSAEIKQLKQELRRKDSALAEATALLVLKKKAALIWGEDEVD